MATSGIEYIYIETHDYDASAAFWQALGFEPEMLLGRAGRFAHPAGGSPVFIEEVPEERELSMRLYLKTPGETEDLGPAVSVAKGWHPSHWGSSLLQAIDPDGREVVLQHRG